MIGIIGENFTGGLRPGLNESTSKEDKITSITGPPTKFTDGFKSSLNSNVPLEIDAETSLSLSSATSRQVSTSGANP
ncbi:hypothetical protein AYI68_g3041 [Smittium mucronatum]|uniref:Uncharacterized protein n=1 Tax=Smittium mucronatum TaxID=133383 RepID=A0A1R0H116_9FUNG|nr:hypothetical protein AYI68_g3041 [Smittium mucronatum]